MADDIKKKEPLTIEVAFDPRIDMVFVTFDKPVQLIGLSKTEATSFATSILSKVGFIKE